MASITINWTDTPNPAVTNYYVRRDGVQKADILAGNGTYEDSDNIVQGNTYVYTIHTNVSSVEIEGQNKLSITATIDADLVDFTYSSNYFDFTSIHVERLSGLAITPDGTRILGAFNANNSIIQIDMSTPHDLTTGVYNSVELANVGVSAWGIQYKADGTKLYVCNTNTTNNVDVYSLATPWDIATATHDGAVSFLGVTTYSFHLDSTGTKGFAGHNGTTTAFTLSTPWDLSTWVAVSNEPMFAIGVASNGAGDKLYTGITSADSVRQYNLTTPWDVANEAIEYTMAPSTLAGVSASNWYGIEFSNDMAYFYATATGAPFRIQRYEA